MKYSLRKTDEDEVEDEDVAEERERVTSGDADDDMICLKDLTKVYISYTIFVLILRYPSFFYIYPTISILLSYGLHLVFTILRCSSRFRCIFQRELATIWLLIVYVLVYNKGRSVSESLP